MKHAFLQPSGASAWSRCALWPTMNRRFPQDNSPETIEGTAAHWVGWEILAGRIPSEGSSTPEGVIVTGEMLDGGELLADTIMEKLPDPGWRRIEQTLQMSQIHPTECFGTPDCWGVNYDTRTLHIIDYKFGHRFVDEWFNLQCLLYAVGALEKLDVLLNDVTIEITIVQPRCYYRGAPVRSHRFAGIDAIDHLATLCSAAWEALKPNPIATTNPACSDCPGRHACDALQLAAYSDAETSNNRQPHDLTPQAAALELKMLQRAYERLGARVDGLQQLTEANLRRGASIPYFHLEPTKPREQWSIPIEQMITIGKLMGKDLEKKGIITPKQAAKKGIDGAVISAYTQQGMGSMKLVPDNPTEARKVFSR